VRELLTCEYLGGGVSSCTVPVGAVLVGVLGVGVLSLCVGGRGGVAPVARSGQGHKMVILNSCRFSAETLTVVSDDGRISVISLRLLLQLGHVRGDGFCTRYANSSIFVMS